MWKVTFKRLQAFYNVPENNTSLRSASLSVPKPPWPNKLTSALQLAYFYRLSHQQSRYFYFEGACFTEA